MKKTKEEVKYIIMKQLYDKNSDIYKLLNPISRFIELGNGGLFTCSEFFMDVQFGYDESGTGYQVEFIEYEEEDYPEFRTMIRSIPDFSNQTFLEYIKEEIVVEPKDTIQLRAIKYSLVQNDYIFVETVDGNQADKGIITLDVPKGLIQSTFYYSLKEFFDYRRELMNTYQNRYFHQNIQEEQLEQLNIFERDSNRNIDRVKYVFKSCLTSGNPMNHMTSICVELDRYFKRI